jgi:uncharacterized protein (TIGR02246 family)
MGSFINTSRFAAPLALTLLAVTPAQAPAADSKGALSAADQAKIRAVVEAYRSAWLANDPEGVLRVFAEDAVLMPHHGVEPVLGKRAAREFWFPAGGPPTTITAFTPTIDQIEGDHDLAYVRGRSRVEWVTGAGPEAKRFRNAGTNLAVLRRQRDGAWRIAVLMWDDPPPETIRPAR